ncbi:MAG: histidyl-tRNA synthetase [Deferribacteraceae bacterium]|nr:histidyl-tRNA synthetase [Deferribacteraceae bacterium]
MFRKVKGFRDIFGVEVKYWELVESIAKDTFRSFGFNEFKLPILEKVEVFDRGIGASTDIVEKEMFVFKDRNDEILALRPEGTASLVRAFIENNLQNPPGVKKYYYYGPMFRRERPQKGRFRQFYQLGVEVFGSFSPLTDADVINLLYTFFLKCGIQDFLTLEINSVGCPECRPFYRDNLISFLKDKKDELCVDCKRRLDTNPLRVLDCKVDTCKSITENAPLMIDYLCGSCDEHFSETKKYLDNIGIKYVVNPKIVRGLDYYVRTAFEMTTTSLGASSAVGAGGRYDGLIKTLGGPDIPGIGFAIGVDRLVNIMMQKDFDISESIDAYCIIFDRERLKDILPVINNLRKNSISVEFDYEVASVKSQVKKADKLNASYALFFGEDELNKGVVTVKNMKTSTQCEVKIENLAEFIKGELA